ncbi:MULTISPECIES: SDR family NAD(P)-dependent oxidoreductase [Achromobacter]|uniref:Glucose 1-dehydrogenase n=1 Tax=Achromobacter denitrificans TaxID=32002 RepID=A0A6N0JIY1_ACHDE|nr:MULTISPECIES: glucose 1-dehydrogenase [Achromobacter]ASC67184.1 dehydrogenase [Achromobacter denitrificans]MDF3862311.1 SDR family oxidoreductase [Achromobacter denitrificans]QKQ47007.1 glucose 1-dehydrogenase [Achromobacter denitrificans]
MQSSTQDGPRMAVVTGAAQGIGKAIASQLIEDGFDVLIADLRGAVEAARSLGSKAHGCDVDVSDPAQVQSMVDRALSIHGRIDGLVNNAGIYTSLKKKPFEEIGQEEWRRVFEVNVEGVWHCCRLVSPAMRRAGTGAIVNIASASVAKGNPMLLQYVASKGAVLAMTRVLARELGESGIRVNTVSPGFTLSDGVMSEAGQREAQRAGAREARALHRDLQPDDVAGAVSYLMSPRAGMMTGQNITVDGGMTMN